MKFLNYTLLGSLVAFQALAQNTLLDITHKTGPGGQVELELTMAEPPGEPAIFTTDTPARIAIDLSNTDIQMENKSLRIGSGATRSVTAVEAAGRTRVVIDLFRPTQFEMKTEGNKILLTLANGELSAAVLGNTPEAQLLRQFDRSQQETNITNVDFRRGQSDEARIIVTLSNQDAVVDLRQEGERIVLDFYNTNIPANLERRLDVLDFATPVNLIDSYAQGSNSRMEITINGEYEQLAYQAGNQYILEVSRPIEEDSLDFIPIEEKVYEGAKVTFNFQDIPVRSVLQLIADVSGKNIVVSDSVDGSLTMRLVSVPWDQALDIIMDAKQLDKVENGTVIWVALAEEIEQRKAQQRAAAAAAEEQAPLRTAYMQINYASAESIAALVESSDTEEGSGILSGRGSVIVHPESNLLIVTDISEKIDVVRDIIARIDKPIPQVLIESRIVIANNDFGKELGVRFGITAANADKHGNVVSTSGSLEATDRLNNNALFNRINRQSPSPLPVFEAIPTVGGPIAAPPLLERFNVNLPVSAAAGKFGWSVLTADYLLDLELSALETEGRGEVISSPRVITANQTEAYIQQGVEIPYLQASSSGAANIAFKEAVLELRVTPLITPDERVQLTLVVKQDTIGEEIRVSTGATIPSIDTRRIETSVLINNGATVVLGGIYENSIKESDTKVPFLGDLPGLGALFRSTNRSNSKAELLIFITPRILKDTLAGSG